MDKVHNCDILEVGIPERKAGKNGAEEMHAEKRV